MYVIPDHRFMFLAAPRTGSKAVAQALMEQRGAVLIGSHHTTPFDHPEFDYDEDWTICSTIRNHWDAMVSWWFKIERRQRAMTPLGEFLPRFCENNPNHVKEGRLYSSTMPLSTAVLRYELLASDLDLALVGVGLAPVKLPLVRDSLRENKAYQVYYKRAQVNWVRSYFGDEIKDLGYKF